jgi:NAD+ kinase
MTGRVGVLGKTESRDVIEIATKLIDIVKKHDLTLVPEVELAKTLKLERSKSLKQMRVDLLVTLGGDGTVLKALREMPEPKTPILAVNLGRRGYLTEVEPSEFEQSFERWLKGDFQIEKQWRVSVFHKNRLIGDCLNEALLLPTAPEKMLNLDVSQGGRRIIKARSNGFIVATPTGSTAHSFSAGGPVLETSLNVFSLALIAPLQPVKSLVVPADKKLRVRVEEPGPTATLVTDGKPDRRIPLGQSLEFKKSPNSAHFVRFGDTFLQRSLRRLASERENG